MKYPAFRTANFLYTYPGKLQFLIKKFTDTFGLQQIIMFKEFFEALQNKDLETLHRILEDIPDVNIQTAKTYNREYSLYDGGQSPLMLISLHGFIGLVGLLLEKGASVNLNDGSGKTALIYAVYGNQKEISTLLIEKGADVNVLSFEGSPLMIAARNNIKEMVELLIRNGANVNELDIYKKKILDYPLNSEITEILVEAGATKSSG